MEGNRLWLECKLFGFEFNLKMDRFSTMLAFRLPAARIDSIQMLHVFALRANIYMGTELKELNKATL